MEYLDKPQIFECTKTSKIFLIVFGDISKCKILWGISKNEMPPTKGISYFERCHIDL